ncbi:MAG: hypothetical protein M5R36_16230 [Deltaproteobacteria bacterium]|nr:hypothetical protein [Deltaproteobacteria bacterium]
MPGIANIAFMRSSTNARANSRAARLGVTRVTRDGDAFVRGASVPAIGSVGSAAAWGGDQYLLWARFEWICPSLGKDGDASAWQRYLPFITLE